jgi:hypothetical protein
MGSLQNFKLLDDAEGIGVVASAGFPFFREASEAKNESAVPTAALPPVKVAQSGTECGFRFIGVSDCVAYDVEPGDLHPVAVFQFGEFHPVTFFPYT